MSARDDFPFWKNWDMATAWERATWGDMCDEIDRLRAAHAPEPESISEMPSNHQLTHVQFSDGRLTPACTCGWWSADGSHQAFERHIKAMA